MHQASRKQHQFGSLDLISLCLPTPQHSNHLFHTAAIPATNTNPICNTGATNLAVVQDMHPRLAKERTSIAKTTKVYIHCTPYTPIPLEHGISYSLEQHYIPSMSHIRNFRKIFTVYFEPHRHHFRLRNTSVFMRLNYKTDSKHHLLLLERAQPDSGKTGIMR